MVNKYGIIYATASNGAFSVKTGLGLPWKKNPLDLSIFKALTINTNIVMGRKTMESLKNPLKDRKNFVITSGEPLHGFIKTSFDEIKTLDLGIVWFIGGISIFNHVMDFFNIKVVVHNEILEKIDKEVNFFGHPDWDPWTGLDKIYSLNISDKLISHVYGEPLNNDYFKLDKQYIDLMAKLINSSKVKGRNGDVRSAADEDISISATEEYGFPIIQSKFTWMKGVKTELDFFMEGKTDSKILESQGNNIWVKNTSRKFLDSRGLTDYKEGDMGPMYGFKWRHYGSEYKGCDIDYKGYDQVEFVVNEIINNPGSRRIMMTTYDPTTVDKQVLCECHGIVTQFFVRDDKISLKTYQRSADWFLGVPFNISSYALLLRRIVKMVNERSGKNYKAHRSITTFGDAHLYETHLIPALEAIVYSNFQDYKKIDLNDNESPFGYKARRIKAEMVE